MATAAQRVKRSLIWVHLYLGVLLCLLFVAWFISGIAMVYYRSPVVTQAQRLALAEPLDLPELGAMLAPPALERQQSDADRRATVAKLAGRNQIRWQGETGIWHAAWLDDGTPFLPHHAMLEQEARRWLGRTPRIQYQGAVDEHTQWSFFKDVRGHLPLHHFSSGGWWPSDVYVSERTGEVVILTTPSSRLLYWLGPGLHYASIHPIRNRDALWRGLVNWPSAAGTLMCLCGVIVGIWRLRWHRIGSGRRLIPYTGRWMRWHHWMGLALGIPTLTFVFSGLMSMNPAGIFPSTAVSWMLRAEWSGSFDLRDSLAALPASAATIPPGSVELTLHPIGGTPHLIAWQADGRTALLGLDAAGQWQLRPPLSATEIAHGLEPLPLLQGARFELLTNFDNYYYARKDRTKPLPVVRITLNDPARTWLYLDPATGFWVQQSDTGTRARRWLYNGLHSLDPQFLLQRPRLWELLIWSLSLLGIGLSVTGCVISWRWIVRNARSQTDQSRGMRTETQEIAHLKPAGIDAVTRNSPF